MFHLVDQLLVFLQSPGGDESLVTLITGHWVLVLLQVGLVGSVTVEYFTTFITGRLLPSTEVLVDLHMSDQRALHCEGSRTLVTLEGLILGVDPQVSYKVTGLLELSGNREDRTRISLSIRGIYDVTLDRNCRYSISHYP